MLTSSNDLLACCAYVHTHVHAHTLARHRHHIRAPTTVQQLSHARAATPTRGTESSSARWLTVNNAVSHLLCVVCSQQVAVGGYLYVLGGGPDSRASPACLEANSMNRYDPTTDTWSAQPDMPYQRRYFTAVAIL